jgi:DNA primase RepB-like protein
METFTKQDEDVQPPTTVPPACQYLTELFQPNDWLCFTFLHKDTAIPENLFGFMHEAISTKGIELLTKRNQEWHIFVSMAVFKEGSENRTKPNISEVRHIFMDADENGDAVLEAVRASVDAGEIPSPNVIVQSSPGKYQFVFNVAGFDIPLQEAMNRTLQKKFGTDAQAVDAARVLRIPGFKNLKEKYVDKPVAKIIELNPSFSPYQFSEFHIPLTVEPDRTVHEAADDKAVQQSIDYLESSMDAASVGYTRRPWEGSGGGHKFMLDICPWSDTHENGGESDAIAIVMPSSKYAFKCLHAHCADRKWDDFRKYLDTQAGRQLQFGPRSSLVFPQKETVTAVTAAPTSAAILSTVAATPYPLFPYWVMEGTSIYNGLVKPQCDVNSKYEEFLFMPAFVHLLNYLILRVIVPGHSQTTGILLVNVGERGETLKSASCDLAFDYMFLAGLGRKYSKNVSSLDIGQRSLIVTAGSPEGFLVKMTGLECNHGILYYDELAKLVSKASIESSSFLPDLCTMIESGEFGSLTLKHSVGLNAGTYVVSAIMNVPRKNFLKVWAKMDNEDTGLNDRAFFLLEPLLKKTITPRIDVSHIDGACETRRLVDLAVNRGYVDGGDWTLFDDNIQRLGNRTEVRAEIFAMGFAVDLGRDTIDDDCKRRGIALAEYDLATKAKLRPISAENKEGALQQEIVRMLEDAGGQMGYRELCREMHSNRYGTTVWGRAMQGLVESGRIKVTKAKPGGVAPAMVYLLTEDCV